MCHERLYTGVISHLHQQWLSKGVVGMNIIRIGRVINILDRVFFKLWESFDGLVSKKKVFLESSHKIDRHVYWVLEVIEVKISAAFEFFSNEEFI